MANVTNATLRGWLKIPGRHALGRGLYFRVLGDDKAYWAFRYRIDGRVRDMSLGPYPEVTLDEARDRHGSERAKVRTHKRDPLAEKRAAKHARANASAKPTFGEMADAHLRAHQDTRKNERQHRPRIPQRVSGLGLAIMASTSRSPRSLAHAIGNSVTRAYLRSTMIERRRKVMQAWADYLAGESKPTVIQFKGTRVTPQEGSA
jgi:hypothetical protein